MSKNSTIEEPSETSDVRILPRIVKALVKFRNAWNNVTLTTSTDGSTGVVISDSNVTIKLPPGSGGGGKGGLGPVVFNGAANGQACFFLINSDGMAYSTAPSGYPIANPD